MKVLVACEESQRVCKEFLELGHDAYSCDIKKTSGGVPKRHILMDAIAVINGGQMRLQTGQQIFIDRWDMIIAHPPCTFLTNVATGSHSVNKVPVNWINARTEQRIEAMRFFMKFVFANCDRIAIENPVGIMSTVYRKPDQIIQPWQFAEDETENVTKATCLWLKNLPQLIFDPFRRKPEPGRFGMHPSGKFKVWEELVSVDRETIRSKTFNGIAKAMAEQWGGLT